MYKQFWSKFTFVIMAWTTIEVIINYLHLTWKQCKNVNIANFV